MPEFRRNILNGNWVVIAEERLNRPKQPICESVEIAETLKQVACLEPSEQKNVQQNYFRQNHLQQNNFPQENLQQENLPQNNIQQKKLQQENISQSRFICPFCPGHEDQTPKITDILWSFDEKEKKQKTASQFDQTPTAEDQMTEYPPSNWVVRSFLNKYPALTDTTPLEYPEVFEDEFFSALSCFSEIKSENDSSDKDNISSDKQSSFDKQSPFDKQNSFDKQSSFEKQSYFSCHAWGKHEVIVDTPRHILSLSAFTDQEMEGLFRMYRRRLKALASEPQIRSVLLFKNVGERAGASLPHSHSQLTGLPMIPPDLALERKNVRNFRNQHGKCLYCEIIQKERQEKIRVVEETEHFLAFCPFGSRFSMEVSVCPKEHLSHMENLSDAPLIELGQLIRRLVCRLETWNAALNKNKGLESRPLAYNLILRNGIYIGSDTETDHFYWTVKPALSKAAGFEWGCGLFINPIAPENAARQLRDIFLPDF